MKPQILAELGKLYYQIAEQLEDNAGYLAYEKAQQVYEEIIELNSNSNVFQMEYLIWIYLNLGKYEQANELQNKYESRIWPPGLHLKIFSDENKGPVNHGSAFYLSRFAMWLKKYSKSRSRFNCYRKLPN